jgi:hypothetical protein
MVGASVHDIGAGQTTPSAAPAALEKAHFGLSTAVRARGHQPEPGGWPRELADMMRACNGADSNAYLRPNAVWRSHSTISGRQSREQSSRGEECQMSTRDQGEQPDGRVHRRTRDVGSVSKSPTRRASMDLCCRRPSSDQGTAAQLSSVGQWAFAHIYEALGRSFVCT